jgi:predicted dienelactone hydrolase
LSRKARTYPHDMAAGRSPVVSLMLEQIGRARAEGRLVDEPPLDVALALSALAQGLVSMHRAGRFGGDEQFRESYGRVMGRALDGYLTQARGGGEGEMKRVLKLAGGLLGLLGLFAAGLVGALAASAVRPERPVGVRQALASDPGHAPVPVMIFYPTDAKPRLVWLGAGFARLAPNAPVAGGGRPLVVIPHGTGGGPVSHLDTALALAAAGYVVAAPAHVGDNFRDSSSVGTGAWIVDRARQIARVNDFLLERWTERGRIDPRRVGVFGFSAGGTTALVTVGGTPALARVEPLCRTRPEFVCRLMKPGARTPSAEAWTHDARVRAVVVVAPGLGFTFEPKGLAAVHVPVQLWEGSADSSLPLATNAGAVRGLLPESPEFHLVRDADHFSFLTPCGPMAPLLPRMLCTDPRGFDRKAFHRQFNAAVVAFFDRALAAPRPGGSGPENRGLPNGAGAG